MSSIVVAGDVSGSVTIAAPSAAGSTTLTLPSTSGTFVTDSATQTLTNKTLTSPTLTTPALGTPASGTLTNCTGLPLSTGVTGSLAASALPAGSVLQVVQGTYTAASSIATNINVGYSSYPSTGLTATITPSSSSNKIIVMYTLNGSGPNGYHMVTVIKRAISGGSTSYPFLGDSAASTYQVGSGTRGIPPNDSTINQQSGTYLDSPSTTSAITYTIVGASEGATTWYINNNGTNTTGTTWAARFASSITLMEIKG